MQKINLKNTKTEMVENRMHMRIFVFNKPKRLRTVKLSN